MIICCPNFKLQEWAGQYYTPQSITQFITDIINPKPGEKVLDPASGTGGFLISAYKSMLKNSAGNLDVKEAQENIKGTEVNQLALKLSKMNLFLHGLGKPNIKNENALAKPFNDIQWSDKVDIIVTNPPFGGVVDQGIAMNFPKPFRTRSMSDLFFVRIIEQLREKGRCAIVAPNSFLFGKGAKTQIKKELLSECNLHTIIRLPHGVFSPFTAIKTNILFFTKGQPTKEIWYFEHPLPEGRQSYGITKPLRLDELELEKEWWNNREEKKFACYCWKASLEQIRQRDFNLDLPNPNRKLEIKIDSKYLKAYLKDLKNTLPGRDYSKQFQVAGSMLIGAIFDHELKNLQLEKPINDGRGFIDAYFQNRNKEGFFKNIKDMRDIKCPWVPVEFKNYVDDLNNPEFDQLAERLDPIRGMFGILVCRRLDDKKKIIERCRDKLRQYKYIVVLDETDFEKLVYEKIKRGNESVDDYMELKLEEVIN
jgi:type I restriction enzyme M protein